MTTPSGREGVSREQEDVRCRTSKRTPEQVKVHQVAKRVLNCQEDAESLGRRRIVRKVPSDQESVKQRGGHQVARRLLLSLLAAAKATVSLNVGAGGRKYAFGLKLPLQSTHCIISRFRTHCTTSYSCQLHKRAVRHPRRYPLHIADTS